MQASSTVRIIAGKWRGSRIAVPAAEGLRPSGDRVRETLFNWLAPYIHGAHCLDAFAGTGVLGFEALSRGAASVTACEVAAPALAAIEAQRQRFDCNEYRLHRGSFFSLPDKTDVQYDLVFLDPPFAAAFDTDPLSWLLARQWLADDALVYIERDSRQPPLELPQGWTIHREKTAAGVWFALLCVDPN